MPPAPQHTSHAEEQRLLEDDRREKNWKRWGPYLSERQWATVREDYSATGDCWNYFPHDHARSRTYRWGEDGLLGITDRECRLCFAFAFWNHRDPILKERLFGLTGPEGNHGEDVKEQYFYLDSTPTHSYMKALYKYPQTAFPYDQLVEENRRRSRSEPEFELLDTGIFDDGRYFDIVVEYAKADTDDILIRLTIHNRGLDAAPITVLPNLWFRNTWSWGAIHEEGVQMGERPAMWCRSESVIETWHGTLGTFFLAGEADGAGAPPRKLFTENETNVGRVFGAEESPPYVKDAFHRAIIDGEHAAVNPADAGTKAAWVYPLNIGAGKSVTLRFRLTQQETALIDPFKKFDALFAERQREADDFFKTKIGEEVTEQERLIARQAYAGLLWSKQFYHYVVDEWLKGDPTQPAPPPERQNGRNTDWRHLYSRDVILMPDKWEYPWFAAWDLAFHTVALAKIDPGFAKSQLELLLREWYMHPNGQIPAYEFAFSDVNPPVHAWAAWRVYKMTAPRGRRDIPFLERCFHKLMLNFTWWVNRKDVSGRHLFAGGFLGLDNIGIFDRSLLPGGGDGRCLEQADGTAWMAFYCSTMLAIAIELALHNAAYEDIASKFFEHFVSIVDAINTLGGTGLWDDQDGFYYDHLRSDTAASMPLRVRSLVGLVPLFAVEVFEKETLNRLPGFTKRMRWFLDHRRDLARNIAYMEFQRAKADGRYLLAVPSRDRLERVLRYLMDENEFLSPFGIRSLSKIHKDHPFSLQLDGQTFSVAYCPGESDTGLFGGNSNWRGPVWMPMNFLLIEALERYDHFYGSDLHIRTGDGSNMTLRGAIREIRRRLAALFLPDSRGCRPSLCESNTRISDPAWRDLLLFHEYFHGDTGRGLGPDHQTGWTALIAQMLGCDESPVPMSRTAAPQRKAKSPLAR